VRRTPARSATRCGSTIHQRCSLPSRSLLRSKGSLRTPVVHWSRPGQRRRLQRSALQSPHHRPLLLPRLRPFQRAPTRSRPSTDRALRAVRCLLVSRRRAQRCRLARPRCRRPLVLLPRSRRPIPRSRVVLVRSSHLRQQRGRSRSHHMRPAARQSAPPARMFSSACVCTGSFSLTKQVQRQQRRTRQLAQIARFASERSGALAQVGTAHAEQCSYIVASSTKLKGVSLARRRCPKPPASITSRSLASPA
jgi:hypothetical protein